MRDPKQKRPWVGLLVACAVGAAFSVVVLRTRDAHAGDALSYGKGGCGKLEGGVQLPCAGENFEAFSRLACGLGRNHLHPDVAATLIDAFAILSDELPGRRWQYAELGLKDGGPLRPHKTHQSGVAADFFVPVVDEAGKPAEVPIRMRQKYGYSLEFDRRGRLPGASLTIDFKALARHLLALERAGAAHGVRIERVILTPDFHRALFAAAPELAPMRARFMKKEAWVRHDEHYHVDFELPAKLRRPLRCAK